MADPTTAPSAAPRRPLKPMASGFVAGVIMAAILGTIGAMSIISMRSIMERDAQTVVGAATVGAASRFRGELLDSVSRTGDDPALNAARRTVAALAAALPDMVKAEVLRVRNDSLAPIAARAAGIDSIDIIPGPARPVPTSAVGAWRAGKHAVTTLRSETGIARGFDVLAPIRRPDGTVAGAVRVESDAGQYVRWESDLKETILVGALVSLAIAVLAGLGVYRVERGRDETAKEMLAAKEAAEAIARGRGEFLANMSHEIRTPLHGVLGMTEALLAMPHTEADRRSLGVINRSASSLLGILNDILDYSKLEAGRVDLVNAPFDPRALVDDVTDLFAVRAEEKLLDLAVRETTRAEHWPVGDAARVRQVLLNLVGNAVKFTEHGSVQVELSTVAIGRKTVVLRIAVRDTGIGIAPDVQARVFEQFSQADTSTSRRFGGTGLGLTISRQLVLLMGGSISVSSVPAQGAEFVVNVQLPAAPSGADAQVTLPFPVGERVLICTPMPATLAALSELCTRERLTVVSCATTAEAEKFMARGDRFAAVFCETNPGEKGPHPLGRKKQPLVMLTTVHHPLNNSTLSSLGAVAQLRRPVRQDHFTALLSDLAAGRLTLSAIEAAVPASTPSAAVSAPAKPKPAPAAPDPNAPRVLVVDDVDLNLMVAKAMLGSLGVNVRTAPGGEEALAILAKEPMDLVLMDCHMPGLDGYEVTRCVRASDGPNKDAPIIALSASAFAEDKERAIASGMNDFATKPIELESLRGVLTRWATRTPATATPA